CWGDSSETDSAFPPWLAAQDFSESDEPMVKLPSGTTTISGHSGQSRNAVPGLAAPASSVFTWPTSFLTTWPASRPLGNKPVDNAARRMQTLRVRLDWRQFTASPK